METSLHRQLKERYATGSARIEAPLGAYRIDVATDDELIEIQHGPLAAIRDKVRELLGEHRVRVVKPIVRRKQLIKQDAKGGEVLSQRRSPKAGGFLDVFDELVHFLRVFPHSNLMIDVPLVDIEEWRYPGHGRRRWRRDRDHVVEDQKLSDIQETRRLHAAADLWQLLPADLPAPFDTADVAAATGVSRYQAQCIAYCLRESGAARQVGKQGNSRLYERA